MDKNRKIIVAKSIVVLSVIPALIYGFSTGPDPRKTGAPGDSICAESGCHVGTAVNGGPGRVTINFPAMTYTPGTKQTWTVIVSGDPQASVYGFQASARPASNEANGQAGSFTAGAGTRVICEDGAEKTGSAACGAGAPVEFIEHTMPSSTGTWTIEWTPPATDVGNIRVFVAGNAANNDRRNSGDRIYTANFTLTPAAGGPKPSISQGGVVNAWSFQAGVASSSFISIFGKNLASSTRNWDGAIQEDRLPTQLDGVGATINGKPAAVHFISPNQINVLAPADEAEGNVQVVVTGPNGNSDPITVLKQRHLPAFYTPFSQEGRFFVTALTGNPRIFVGKAGLDPRVQRAVRPGDILEIFAIGFGPTNPAAPTDRVFGGAAPVTTQPTVRFGETVAEVQFAGLVGAGLYQLNVVVPATAPDGDIPLIAEIGGVRTASNVFITIQK